MERKTIYERMDEIRKRLVPSFDLEIRFNREYRKFYGCEPTSPPPSFFPSSRDLFLIQADLGRILTHEDLEAIEAFLSYAFQERVRETAESTEIIE